MVLDSFFRIFTNLIYFVPLKVKQFKANEPNSQVLAAGATKARQFDKDVAVQYAAGWIAARRGTLILTDQKLVCGSWEIPLSTVNKAVLLRVKALFAKALVLKVSTTDGHHYQFGLQYDPVWETQTALKLTIEESKIKYSAFSIALRVILGAWVIWLFIRWLT
jgi:hypothetical protein